MKRGALFLLLALALAWPEPGLAGPLEKALKSVVSVLPEWPPDARRAEEPEGSGVVVFDGRTILTAAHVVERALSVKVRTGDGEILEARIKGRDRATDLAVLTVARALPAIEIELEDPEIGETVCAIGNPQGVGLSLRCGVVSALHRAGMGFNHVEDFVQTDAAVNPGDSGGALVNREGRLVGVLQAILSGASDAGKGLSFAVAARLAARAGDALSKHGRFTRVPSGLRLAYGRTGKKPVRLGAKVVSARPGMAGERAGIEAGDIIVRAGGRRIRKPADFVSVMAGVAEKPIEVILMRGGVEKTVKLTP